MCQFLYFHVFFLFATNTILSVESSNLLDTSIITDPLSSECGTSTLPSIKPQPPSLGLPVCEGSEDELASYALINGALDFQFFEERQVKNDDIHRQPCDNTELIKQLTIEFGLRPKECRKCDACDFPYVVFIFTEIKGKKVQVCQGVRLADGSILTIYGCVQMGQRVWIQSQCPRPDSQLEEAECVAAPGKHAYPDGFSDTTFTVRLILKSNCSSNEFTSTPQAGLLKDAVGFAYGELVSSFTPFVSGYLVVKDDCSSDRYSISCKPGLFNGNYGFVLLDKQDDLCHGYQGALFIGDDGRQYGMALYKSGVVWNLKTAFPGIKTVIDTTRCLIPLDAVLLN